MEENVNNKLNTFLNNERISKEYYDELKYVAIITNFDYNILKWFRKLHSFEVQGWRNKTITKKICEMLANRGKIQFYALFCPSYLKGEGKAGFRTDDVGNTSKNGLQKLKEITAFTRELGFDCEVPEAIFFDIALEQPEKTIGMLEDLRTNIDNFLKYVPNDMKFSLLSERFPELLDIVGRAGIVLEPLPVDEKVLKRIVERGKKFYDLFGWEDEKIIARSKVIASSEAMVGTFLRYRIPNGIMVYTPTMLERAQVYSGKRQEDPLVIVVPKK